MGKCKDCIFLIEVNKHPWNEGIGKGSISERMGFGCILPLQNDLRISRGGGIITYSDTNEGSCEMFTPKSKYKSSITVKDV